MAPSLAAVKTSSLSGVDYFRMIDRDTRVRSERQLFLDASTESHAPCSWKARLDGRRSVAAVRSLLASVESVCHRTVGSGLRACGHASRASAD